MTIYINFFLGGGGGGGFIQKEKKKKKKKKSRILGEFSTPGSTFCADSYFGIRTTPVLPQ